MSTAGVATTLGQERAAYIAGLRGLADLLERVSEVPTPYTTRTAPITIFGCDARAVEALATVLGRPVASRFSTRDSDGTDVVWLTWQIDGLHVQISADADQVGRAPVTEVRTVTRWTLPDHLTPADVPPDF